jgi:DNA repair exonuclease SbcCD ATPase subunit
VSKERRELKRLKQEVKNHFAAQSLVQHTAEEIQNIMHSRIGAVVSKCLSTVFDDPYNFRILIEKKRGKTEARLVFERDGLEVDPLDAAGGGVVDIAAFALRLACILCSLPQLRRVMILDEPFKHLHRQLRPLAGQLLQTLGKETGTQFIVVTHSEEVEVGKIVRVK